MAVERERESLFYHNINMKTMIIQYINQGGLPERQKPIKLATHYKNIREFILPQHNMKTMIIQYINQGGLPERQKEKESP